MLTVAGAGTAEADRPRSGSGVWLSGEGFTEKSAGGRLCGWWLRCRRSGETAARRGSRGEALGERLVGRGFSRDGGTGTMNGRTR